VAAGAVVRGYDPAVAVGPGITDTGGERPRTCSPNSACRR
jgi:hypothetical protein